MRENNLGEKQMNQVKNKEEIARLLMQLITKFSTRKISEDNNKQEIFEILNCLDEIIEIQKASFKEQFGEDYEEIKFEPYFKEDNTYGSYRSNIIFDKEENTITKELVNHKIKINTYKILEKLKSDKTHIRIFGCINLLNTIFHELTHFKQNSIKQSEIIDIDAINFAKQDILTRTRYNEVYKENYYNMPGEIDARLAAYDMTIEVLDVLPDKEYLEKLFNDRVSTDLEQLRTNATLFHEEKDGRDQDREVFLNQRVDKFIEEHPDVLNIYKSLLVEYNIDGKRKSNLQLIKELGKHFVQIEKNENMSQQEKSAEKIRIRNTYFDILGSRLQDITREEAIELEDTFGTEGKGGTKVLYDLMAQHYLEEHKQKISDLERLQKIMSKKGKIIGVTDNFEAQKQIIRSKYTRLLLTTINLSSSYYKTPKNAINGVDMEYVESVKLTEEQQSIKDRTIASFIKLYDNLDTEKEFKIRQKQEQRNIRQVLNAVEFKRCSIGFMKSFELGKNKRFSEEQIIIMMRALKAAEKLSVDGKRNYLREFGNVPFVNDMLSAMCKDETLKQMIEKSRQIQSKPTTKHENETLEIKDKFPYLINLEDLKEFAESEIVLKCVVNGKKYNAIQLKESEELEQ